MATKAVSFGAKSFNEKTFVDTLEEWFSKLPALPVSIKEILVQIAPWLALIFGILGVVGSIAATGLLTVLSPFAALGGGLGLTLGGIVGSLIALAGSVLMVMAFPGLRDRKAIGWRWSFWSETVSVVGSILGLNLVGAVLGALIGYYLLFQIKGYYK